MPNWCSNSLHFQGNPQRIAEVAEQILIKSDEGYQFSFQHIVPMPEELNLTEGSNSYMQQTWLQIAQQPEKKLTNLEQEMLEQHDKPIWPVQYRLPDNIFSKLKQYLSENFDWDNLTIGEVFAHFKENPEIAARFGYDETFAKRFPDLVFEARYLEEGMWFAGTFEGHEGALFDYPCTDDEVRNFAIEHFGCEYDDDD